MYKSILICSLASLSAQAAPATTTATAKASTTFVSSTLKAVTTTSRVSSSVKPSSTPAPVSNSTNPCARLSSSYSKQAAAAKGELTQTTYKVTDVLACLRDVPINSTAAAAQVDYIKQYMQFQSTLAYLKNPPKSYPYPPTDILGGLDKIASKTKSGGYKNQFDFEIDIVKYAIATYDGHTAVNQFLVSNFNFLTNVLLVSISGDGNSLPGVYFLQDILLANATYAPSDIISIDGVDVTERLLSRASSNQDLDALYNSALYNPSNNQVGSSYAGSSFIFSEDSHTYKFRNGTSATLSNIASTKLSLEGIKSGKDIYENFLVPSTDDEEEEQTPSSSSSSSTAPSKPSDPVASNIEAYVKLGFPTPVAVAFDNSVGGYFLQSDPSVAVLNVRAFTGSVANPPGAPKDYDTAVDFQQTVTSFLNKSKAAGKTKLIVDVRGNGGGAVFTGYDLFRQLFPSLKLEASTRFRSHQTADYLGTLFSQFPGLTQQDIDLDSKDNDTKAITLAKADAFNFHSYIKPSGGNFSSWKDLYGPVMAGGDNFTQTLAFDFNNVAQAEAGGLQISGTGDLPNFKDQIFKTENILLITDAACASTCGLFSNLMIKNAQVKTLVMGGRPSKNQMVAIGGTQGAQVLHWDVIQSKAANGLELLAKHGAAVFKDSALLKSVTNVFQKMVADPPINFDVSASAINFRDSFFGGNGTDTPLQFQNVKKADCRVFYTAGDIKRVATTWERIVAGNYDCVDGGKKW
ncbi:hypothetical protein BT63DRAFT_413514 [Microthyrium microscopicum]|uniref:Uncharacterized protein n=1 Tax=Microthyrium microscopicum TaxID=703497 RepID=A0A6A6UA28_9PEZI|nr:hypothetical protein BT63DRAFT_413514 [Microthyrium microscopicum]